MFEIMVLGLDSLLSKTHISVWNGYYITFYLCTSVGFSIFKDTVFMFCGTFVVR